MDRDRVSLTTKPVRSFPPVNVQIISTGTKDTRVFSDDHISGDTNANKVSVRHHLKINAFWKSIVSLVYSTVCVCVCVCRAAGIKLKGWSCSQVWRHDETGRWACKPAEGGLTGGLRGARGGKGRKRAGELIKARFVDGMRGRTPSCWLPTTQWSSESPPHPLPQEGAGPYAGSRWQWLAEEHPLLFWEINVKCL